MLQLVCNELGESVVTCVIMCIMRCEFCNWCNKVYNELGMSVVTGIVMCIMR